MAGSTSKGLGSGLYLAHRIALAHHGSLTVEPDCENEVCFTFAMPVETDDVLEDPGTPFPRS